jgi:hypothetical protein
MDDATIFEQLQRAISDMRASVESRFDANGQRFVSIEQRFDAIDRRFDAVDGRFDAVDRELVLIRQEIRQGDEETRSQLKARIESLHDDVRIIAVAQVAMDRRVSTLEGKQT